MKHASIRTRLILTYFTSVALAAALIPMFYHWFTGKIGTMTPEHYPSYVGHMMILAVLLALLYGYWMGRDILRKITELANGARNIANGDLTTRIPVRGQDELAQLAAIFNDMIARLQAALEHEKSLEQSRRALVANVAHDLRTPLAAVRASVEALEEGVVADEATRTRYLAAIGRETRHLGTLIDDLMALSQLEAGQLELNPETIYLEDVIQDCLAGLLPQAERAGVTVTVEAPAILPPVRADRRAARRVLTNLLQNALAFTPADGRIVVRGTLLDGEVQIEVCDTGRGIAPQDLEPGPDGLPRIFERFYRADAARSPDAARAGGGVGLGLAIARELTQAQGGRIWAESIAGKGATIGFTLPVSPEP